MPTMIRQKALAVAAVALLSWALPAAAQDAGVGPCELPELIPPPDTITTGHPGWIESPHRVRTISKRQPDGTFAEVEVSRVVPLPGSLSLIVDDPDAQLLELGEPLVEGDVYRLYGVCESGSAYWERDYTVVAPSGPESIFEVSRATPIRNEAALLLRMRDEAEPYVDRWQWTMMVDGNPAGMDVLRGSRFWAGALDCGGFGSDGLRPGSHRFEVHSAPIGVEEAVVIDGPHTFSFECIEEPEPLVDCSGPCDCSTTGPRGGFFPALALGWLITRRRRLDSESSRRGR